MPRYLAYVLKVPILQNGLYSALPSTVMLAVIGISGPLSDFLINRNYLSIRNSRVFFNSMSTGLPGFFMIGASYAGCDQVTVMILFALSKGFMGFLYSGIKMNTIDLSPNYAGVINALCNGFGAISGFMAPYVVGLLTTNVYVILVNYFCVQFTKFFHLIFRILWQNGELHFGCHSEFCHWQQLYMLQQLLATYKNGTIQNKRKKLKKLKIPKNYIINYNVIFCDIV